MRLLQLEDTVALNREAHGQAVVVLKGKEVGIDGSSQGNPAFLSARSSLLVVVNVVVRGDLVKRALLVRSVVCRSFRLPVLPRVTVVPRVIGLGGHDEAALVVSPFPPGVANYVFGSASDSTNMITPCPSISMPWPVLHDKPCR